MVTLLNHLDEPGRLVYPGMIVPQAKSKSELAGGSELYLPNHSVEERLQKYFEFCRVFDDRTDPVLRDHFQQHSHRLHWQEHPYVDVIKDVTDLRDKIWFTLIFSFTNEHWLTFKTIVEGGEQALIDRLKDESIRVQRNDLFQIYYPKGTKIREWIIRGTKQAADEMVHAVGYRNQRWGMMNLAKLFADYFVKYQGFRNALYPNKNFARYMAMGSPDLVDPESYIHPGTGSFRGFHQVFGDKYLMARADYDVDENGAFVAKNDYGQQLYDQFTTVSNHPLNPVKSMNLINHEDKMCFFFKRLAYEAGVQKATSQIPYSWIFPEFWNLKTGKYDRVPVSDWAI